MLVQVRVAPWGPYASKSTRYPPNTRRITVVRVSKTPAARPAPAPVTPWHLRYQSRDDSWTFHGDPGDDALAGTAGGNAEHATALRLLLGHDAGDANMVRRLSRTGDSR